MRFLVFAAALLLAGSVTANTPRLINYQGVLTDPDGTPVADDDYSAIFSIYADATTPTPLWTETHAAVTVTAGVFSVILGGTTPLTDGLFNATERWIGIKVGANDEISPRSQLTAVPWALRAAVVDNGGSGDSVWQTDGTNVYRESGNVGIGTPLPAKNLHIRSDDPDVKLEMTQNSPNNWVELGFFNDAIEMGRLYADKTINVVSLSGLTGLRLRTGGADRLAIDGGGQIGIGTSMPSAHLDIASTSSDAGPWAVLSGGGSILNNIALRLFDRGTASGNHNIIEFSHSNAGSPASVARIVSESVGSNSVNGGRLTFQVASNNAGGYFEDQLVLDHDGRTKVRVLEITGADLVESFDISDRGCQPGTVVVIDDAESGRLRSSSTPYDTRVAGVVSGAGGLAAGIHMGEGSGLGGDIQVAMTGRVYVKCTADNGAIKPGDLLTTSDKPGRAMKATDRDKSMGAVLGKAMTPLETGEGLVLVLVNLQ